MRTRAWSGKFEHVGEHGLELVPTRDATRLGQRLQRQPTTGHQDSSRGQGSRHQYLSLQRRASVEVHELGTRALMDRLGP